ncbi:Tar ligand binding domain-containing protein [Halomonas nitroreducens]|nr:Tar ligand binding domain-containing protein [Halomonas nitroreducens]
MRLLDRMTIRLSWCLVLVACSGILLGTGALGLYANQHGRDAFQSLREVNVQQSRALNQAYIATLRAQVAMDRAAHLLRVPSFDHPGPVIERADAHLAEAKARRPSSASGPCRPPPGRRRRWMPRLPASSRCTAPVFVPLMTLSLALHRVRPQAGCTALDVANVLAELKGQAKRQPGNSLFVDRRQ